MSLAVVDAGADDDAVITDAVGRRRGVHVQIPARAGGQEIREAEGRRPVVEERNRERRGIVADHPTGRVYSPSGAFARACGQRNRDHSARIRPDEWQA